MKDAIKEMLRIRIAEQDDEIEHLRDHNFKLREALRRIEEMKDVRTPAAVKAVARAALGEEKE